MKHLLVTLTMVFLITSCTDAGCSKLTSLGDSAHVICHSGGKVIYDGYSTGKISSESGSDGYYFKDKKTKNLIEVSGDCHITYLD